MNRASPPSSPSSRPNLARTPSLKEAEDGRLMARIERNFECLRRDGRAAGTLSGWGDLLRTKFKNHKAETSDLAPAQSATCAAWLSGALTGRVAMVEFLQAETLVRKSIDPTSVTGAFGLGDAILNTDWLHAHVFSRPPQAVIYETLLSCAEDALERKPENLTAQQINLALRKLALNYLPRSGEAARAQAAAAAASAAAAAAGEQKGVDGEEAGQAIQAAPGDEYLRIQVAMELLKLHVSSPEPANAGAAPFDGLDLPPTSSGRGGDGSGEHKAATTATTPLKGKQDSARTSSPGDGGSGGGGGGPGGRSLLEELAAAAASAVGARDGDSVVRQELGLVAQSTTTTTTTPQRGGQTAGHRPLGGGGEEDEGYAEVEGTEALETLNRFLEAYAKDLTEVKHRLSHQVRWLEERGAYRLLGVDPGASEAQVKKCYHKLSLKAHPDKGGDPETFLKLKVAYETVLKKKKRALAREAKVEARRQAHDAAKHAARAQARAEAEQAMRQRRRAGAPPGSPTWTPSATPNDDDAPAAPAASSPRTSPSASAQALRAKQMAKYGRARRPPPTPGSSSAKKRGASSSSSSSSQAAAWGSPRKSTAQTGHGEDEATEDDEEDEVSWELDPDDSSARRRNKAEEEEEEENGEEAWARRTHRRHEADAALEQEEEEAAARRLHAEHEVHASKEREGFEFDPQDGAGSEEEDEEQDLGMDVDDFFASGGDDDEEDDGEGGGKGVGGKSWAQEFISSRLDPKDDDDEEHETYLDDDDDDDDDEGIWPDGRSDDDGGGDEPLTPERPHSPLRPASPPSAASTASSGGWEFDVNRKGPVGTERKQRTPSSSSSSSSSRQKQRQQEEGEEEERERQEEGGGFSPRGDPIGGSGDGPWPSSSSSFVEEEEELLISAGEHRAKLGELESKAKAAAKKAASLAHICIQWSKVVEEVRVLTRPRGVEHLGGLINKGAFSSAVDVMEPTQEAATCVMDIVASAIHVTKETPRTMGLASSMGFFQTADRVTTEGRTALSAAAAAAEVNAAAVKAMGKLSSLGELAREDDEVHTALVDMLCLHFQRVAESTQACAKQALVAVTAASHVCSLLDALHDQAKLEAESAGDEDDEEEEEDADDELHPEDKRRKEEAEAEARERAQAARKAQQGAAGGGEEERGSEHGGAEEGGPGAAGKENKGGSENGAGGGGVETVESLVGKLKDLHVQMRQRHGANLRKMNAEVLVLQRRLEECLRDSALETASGGGGRRGGESSSRARGPASPPPLSAGCPSAGGGSGSGGEGSGGEWRAVLFALADLVNSTCLQFEGECRAHLTRLHAQRLDELREKERRQQQQQRQARGLEGEEEAEEASPYALPVVAPPAALPLEWWQELLLRKTAWLETLAHRGEVAIAPTGRGKILRLAAAVDLVGVRRMLGEMGGRLKALLNELAFEGHTSPGAPRHRAALDKRFCALAAPLFARGSVPAAQSPTTPPPTSPSPRR